MEQLIMQTNQAVLGSINRAIGDVMEQSLTPTRYARKSTQYGDRFVLYWKNEWLWATRLALVKYT